MKGMILCCLSLFVTLMLLWIPVDVISFQYQPTRCRSNRNSNKVHHHYHNNDKPRIIGYSHADDSFDDPLQRLSSSSSSSSEGQGKLLLNRRQEVISSTLWLQLLAFGSSNSIASASSDSADTTTTTTTILKGVVSLEDGIELPSTTTDGTTTDGTSSALYVTCRPNKPDNVPTAILTGTRGKPPPVLAARYANPSFPFEFTLSIPTDLTIEGASSSTSTTSTTTGGQQVVGGDDDPTKSSSFSNLWWRNDDLIVSARWDSDGVAATRSPEDLVGRGLKLATATTTTTTNSDNNNNASNDDAVVVKITLSGRGAFGKFATGGSNKK